MKKKPTKSNQNKKGQVQAQKSTLFEIIETFCAKNHKVLSFSAFALAILTALLHFTPDVSYGGDDSSYIQYSFNFIKGTAFPSYQGPLYPIILAPFIALFGVNLVVLKLVSVLFSAGAVFIIFKLMAKLANYTIATLVSFAMAANYMIANYAGTTYSEPFFTFLQALFLFLLFNYLERYRKETPGSKTIWKPLLWISLVSFAMFQTRTVSGVALIFTLIVFLFEKQYLSSLLFAGYTGIQYLLLGLYKKLIWGTTASGFKSQLDGLLLKNFYKPAEGNEDFAGMIKRFWVNSELYLSKHLGRLSGFRSYDSLERSTMATLVIYLLVVVGAILIWRKNKNMRYLLLYLAGMAGASFVMLQTTWDQERIIMIYFPLIIAFFLSTFYLVFQHSKTKTLQPVFVVVVMALFLSITVQSLKKIEPDSFSSKFNSGTFASYSPDWQNYMLASKWAAQNLPDSAVVICRKPQMSWVASGGKDFFKGIYRLESSNPDSMVAFFKEMKATHVIMANLRLNPRKKTERTITTIRNSLYLLTVRNPGALTLLKEIGTDEKAYIFKLDLNDQIDPDTYIRNLDAALIVNPHNKQASSAKANYYFSRNEYNNALKYIEFSLAQSPNDPDLHYSKGLCFFQQQNYVEALKSFNNAVKYKPDYNTALFNAAVCHFYLGEFDKARQTLNEAKNKGFAGSTQALENGLAQHKY